MFEMNPLGPFHGKGAGTSISAWVVTTEALAGSRCGSTKVQSPAPLSHLAWKGSRGEETWDVELSARVVRMYTFTYPYALYFYFRKWSLLDSEIDMDTNAG
jgi:hypothetical protein